MSVLDFLASFFEKIIEDMGTKNFITLVVACVLLLFYSPIISFLKHIFGKTTSILACIGIVVLIYTSIGGNFCGNKYAEKVGEALEARTYIARKEFYETEKDESIDRTNYAHSYGGGSYNDPLVTAF